MNFNHIPVRSFYVALDEQYKRVQNFIAPDTHRIEIRIIKYHVFAPISYRCYIQVLLRTQLIARAAAFFRGVDAT